MRSARARIGWLVVPLVLAGCAATSSPPAGAPATAASSAPSFVTERRLAAFSGRGTDLTKDVSVGAGSATVTWNFDCSRADPAIARAFSVDALGVNGAANDAGKRSAFISSLALSDGGTVPLDLTEPSSNLAFSVSVDADACTWHLYVDGQPYHG